MADQKPTYAGARLTQPLPIIQLGDGSKRPVTPGDIVRFDEKITRDGECWEWTGSRTACGYGKFSFRNTKIRAHRFAYLVVAGPTMEGLVLDHLCRNRGCVNPDHLEPVTQAENVRRGEVAGEGLRRTAPEQIDAVIRPLYDQFGAQPSIDKAFAALRASGLGATRAVVAKARKRIEQAEPALAQLPTYLDAARQATQAKSQCLNGHPYEGDNAGRQGMDCRICERSRWARRVGKDPSEIGKPRTHCKNGHAYEGRNLLIDSRGNRQCRTCKRAGSARALAKKRSATVGGLS